jgi:excisionase family DNA binding protein
MNAEPAIRRLCMLNDPQLERESEDRQGQSPQSAAQTWLSIRQLQDLLNIGHTRAYSLVASGEIPSVKIGRIIRINQQDLSEWLNQQKYGSVND